MLQLALVFLSETVVVLSITPLVLVFWWEDVVVHVLVSQWL